jgi:hypothetical protein
MSDDRRTTALAGAVAGVLSLADTCRLGAWPLFAVLQAMRPFFLLPRPCIYLAALLAVLSHNQASMLAVWNTSCSTAARLLLLFGRSEPCHPQTPSVGSLKGLATCRRHPGRRRLRRVRYFNSPTVQPFSRHQRICRAGSKPAQGIDQNKAAAG